MPLVLRLELLPELLGVEGPLACIPAKCACVYVCTCDQFNLSRYATRMGHDSCCVLISLTIILSPPSDLPQSRAASCCQWGSFFSYISKMWSIHVLSVMFILHAA